MRRLFNKRRLGQQLVEFLLVAPFLVIIFGILTEYAYALSVNMTLDEGLKKVTSSIYSKIQPNMSSSDINTLVQNQLGDYLKENNVPYTTENGLNVHYVTSGDNTTFVAGYKYVVAFTLPHAYFHFMPDEFNFSSAVVVPTAFIKTNNYGATPINSTQLDKIWSGSADFSSLDSFKDSQKGIMNNTVDADNDETSSVLFMIPATTPLGVMHNTFIVVPWDGTYTGFYVDLTDNHVYECDTASCSSYSSNFIDFFQTSGVNNLIFYSDFTPSDPTSLGTVWTIGSGKISDKSVDGLLKMALALYDTTQMNSGNYDNINVSAYNMEVDALDKYKIDTFGSMVIIHPKASDVSNAASASSPQNVNYDFGGKVNKS